MADDKKLSDGTDVPVGAEHEMVNLDVEEVSIVSRPAIKRKFLVRKSEGLEVEEVDLEDTSDLTVDTFRELMEEKYVPKEKSINLKDTLEDLVQARKEGNVSKDKYAELAQDLFSLLRYETNVDLADLGGSETEEDFAVSAVYHLTMAAYEGTSEEDKRQHLQHSFLALMGAADVDEDTLMKISKGKALGTLLSNAISRKAKSRADRAVVVQQLADAAGITTEAVYMITTGKIKCPPQKRLAAFAKVLNISEASLKTAARNDGCKLSKEEETMNKLFFDSEKQAICAEIVKEDGSVEVQEVKQDGLLEDLKKHFAPVQPEVDGKEKEEPSVSQQQKSEQESDQLRKEIENLSGLIKSLTDDVKSQKDTIGKLEEGIKAHKEHIEKLEKAAPLSSSDEKEKTEKQDKPHLFKGIL